MQPPAPQAGPQTGSKSGPPPGANAPPSGTKCSALTKNSAACRWPPSRCAEIACALAKAAPGSADDGAKDPLEGHTKAASTAHRDHKKRRCTANRHYNKGHAH